VKPQREDPSIKPNVNIKLTYVPSYNGKTSRNNIIYIDTEHILFYVSDITIIMLFIPTLVFSNDCSDEYKYISAVDIARSHRRSPAHRI